MLKRLYITLLLSILVFGTKGEAIVRDSSELRLGKYAAVLQPGKEISFAEAQRSTHFLTNQKDVPNLGISANSAWLKFTITNTGSDPNLLLNIAYPLLDEVELYSPVNGGYNQVLLGKTKAFDKRPYKSPNYIFNLNIPQNTSKTYYLRIKSSEQIIVPMSVGHAKSLWQNLSKESLICGIYVGIVLIMALYNLFLFFSVRDKSYLYYVIYVVFIGLTQVGIKGYTFQYLWPDLPGFEQISVILFASISSIASLVFTKNFLNTKAEVPKSNVLLSLLIGLFGIAIIITLIGKVQTGFLVMQQATTLLSLGVLALSFVLMIKGSSPAKFFFIAWSVLLTGSIVFLLKDYGVLPYNTFTSYCFQAASAFEMALLSFGLANKINIFKREKEQSQAQALEAARENERIIREQNVMLEQKVKERTVELIELNDELKDTLTNLQQTQTQLVESEKMASLGQLTAGIAHEINNPINFVTSNIKPLRRDVDIMFESLNRMEDIGLSEKSVAEKQKEISDYKEEIDFDYLKEEIGYLFKGIHEGASRTAEIVKGLRVFSRVDEDDLKKADINEGLNSTLIIVNNLLNNRIKIIKSYADLPKVECFPGKLNQVFLNIISNAIHAVNEKYKDKDGGEIDIITESDTEHVLVKIKDNGTGMDEATKKRIFEPFFTTKGVGEGVGLGMSIAYNTIKKHNGKIMINSVKGEGTEFIIQLPLIHILT